MEIVWRPGIGDPTFAGWFTVFLYAAAATLALVLAISFKSPVLARSELRFWGLIALSFVALSINKQLDIQSLFTEVGRNLAKAQGWYGTRRVVQQAFIAGVSGSALLVCVIGAALWWRAPLANKIAQFGTVLVIAFIVIRASSFHDVWGFLNEDVGILKMTAGLEISGISLVLIGSGWRLRQAMTRFRDRRRWDFEPA